MEIKIMKNILDKNQNMAGRIREQLSGKNILMINLISSPGAGKTTLLERTCEALTPAHRIAVIEGDIATDRDARRLERFGIPIVVINTEGGCHLDSHSISRVLPHFDLDNLDIIFVENVGNLICPSQFDLGETHKVAVVSTAEGDDKPAKYPLIFSEASVVILNKTDLIPYTNFSRENFMSDLAKLVPSNIIFEMSCTGNEGLTPWYRWITRERNKLNLHPGK